MDNFLHKLNNIPLWLGSAVLFALAFAQYANTLGHDYVWDDVIVIHGQDNVQKGISGIPAIFTEKPRKEDSPELKDQYGYRPVLLSSMALDVQLFGQDPKMGHLMNVLYFALLCALLFVALRRLLGKFDVPIAFFAVLLFLAHPIHVEAVANIKSRDEILALLFGVLTLLCAMRYAAGGAWGWLPAAAALFAAAIWSKESIVTFAIVAPCSVLVLHGFAAKRFFALAAVLAVVAALALPVSFVERVAAGLVAASANALVYGLYKGHIKPIAWLGGLLAPLKNMGGVLGKASRAVSALPRRVGGFMADNFSLQKIKEGGQLNFGNMPLPALMLGGLLLLALLAATVVLDAKPLAFLLFALLGLLYRVADNPSKSGVLPALALATALLAWNYNLPAMLQVGLTLLVFMFFHRRQFGFGKPAALAIAGFIMAAPLPLLLSIPNAVVFVLFTLATAYLSTLRQPWWLPGVFLGLMGIASQVGAGKYWWVLPPAMALTGVLLAANTNIKRYLPALGFLVLAVGFAEAVVTPLGSKAQAYAYNRGLLTAPKGLQGKYLQEILVENQEEKPSHTPLPTPAPASEPNVLESEPDYTATFVPGAEVPFARIPNPVASNEKGFYLEDKTMNNIIFYADSKSKVVANGFLVLLKYLKNFFVPYPLVYFYGYNQLPLTGWGDWRVILSVFIHLSLLAYALLRLKRDKVVAYAILFYLASIAIYSHMFRILDDAMSDRYMFTASVGLCLLVVLLLARTFGFGKAPPLPAKATRRPEAKKNAPNRAGGKTWAFAVPFLLMTGIYAGMTFFRNQVWKDNHTLFSTDIKHMENCSRAHFYLASSLFEAYDAETDKSKKANLSGRLVHHLKRSIEITPQAFYSQYKLARLYIMEGKYGEARDVLQKMLARYPDEAMPNYLMGYFYFVQDEFGQALPYFEKTYRLAPEYEELFVHLAWTYYYTGQPEEAIAFLRRSIEQMPDVLDLYGILSDIYFETGNTGEAMNCMKTVLQKDPKHEGAYHKLISGLRDMGKEEEAYQYYLQAKSKGIIK